MSITDNISLDIYTTSEGQFATSDTSTNNVTIRTDNGTGYTLGIKAKTEGSNALINTNDPSTTIPSITSAVSGSDYSSSSTYNNTWGYRPSKYNSHTNTNYLPLPTSASSGTVLDKTTVSNPSTDNNYNIAIGTRLNNTIKAGSYSNTFVIFVVANPAIYSITYNQNTSDTVTNMPTNVVNQETFAQSVNISNLVPARSGYNFKGWCTAQLPDGSDATACTNAGGTTYNPDGGGTSLAWPIDSTIVSNSLSLYAMWETTGPEPPISCTTPVPNLTYMQDLNSSNKATVLSNMIEDQQYYLADKRDNKAYCVAKLKDGNIWMTQNLDHDIKTDGSVAYTPTTTDVPETWTPSTATYPTGTTTWNSSVTTPESYDPGELYWSGTPNDTTPVSTGNSHYHLGNYYNWTAAVAMNDSSSYTTKYQDVDQSICPANWTLPKSGNVTTSGSFQYLVTQYGWDSSSQTMTNPNIWNSPIKASLSGGWRGSLRAVGGYGFFWSPMVGDGYSSYLLTANSDGYVFPGGSVGRVGGVSVRCLAR